MKFSEHVALLRESRGVYSVLVEKPEGKRSLGRARRKWKNNIKVNFQEMISSTGVIPKSLTLSLKKLNLYPNKYIQIQKSVILGTCSIVSNFLNYK